jgi:hypothetical protein
MLTRHVNLLAEKGEERDEAGRASISKADSSSDLQADVFTCLGGKQLGSTGVVREYQNYRTCAHKPCCTNGSSASQYARLEPRYPTLRLFQCRRRRDDGQSTILEQAELPLLEPRITAWT